MNHREYGLAGSGGGSSDAGPCGGVNVGVEVSDQVNGQLVDPGITVNLELDQPVMALSRAVGLLATCQGKERIVAVLRSAVPAGLSFDAATGAFSGTLARRSLMRVELSLTAEGYTSSVRRTRVFAV